MHICIYIEPLTVFTSGMACRGMLPELIAQRSQDRFTLVCRRGSERHPLLKELMNQLTGFSNWSLFVERRSRRHANLLALIGLANYNRVSVDADIYINFDADALGADRQPVITLLADLSVIRSPMRSSHGWIGRWLRRRVFSNMVKYATHIVTISRHSETDLQLVFPALSGRSTVIYNGIDPTWFVPINSTRATYDSPYWIWWGHVSERKNLRGLIAAYARAIRIRPELPSLWLVASGSIRALREQVNALGISERVRLQMPRPLPDLVSAVDNSVGLVFPSYYEGFGLPVAEALARGKPVWCASRAALPEIAGPYAILFEPADEDEIVQALLKYDKNLVHPEQTALRQKWASRYTYSIQAQAYSVLINRIAVTRSKTEQI